MWQAIIIGILWLYLIFKMIDKYLPVRLRKKTTLITKHTEQAFGTAMDYSGIAHSVAHPRYLLTVGSNKEIQIEEVDVKTYSSAQVGKELEIVKVTTRFGKRLIKFEFNV